MTPLASDNFCFIKQVNGNFSGLKESYVDDTIDKKKTNFEKESRLTERTFNSKNRRYDSFPTGIGIMKVGNAFSMIKFKYPSNLQALKLECTFEQFRARQN